MATAFECPFSVSAKSLPQAPAICEGSRIYSYEEADALIHRCAMSLRAQGIAPGERVAILSQNSAQYVFVLFALQRLGISALPLNLRLQADDWQVQTHAACAKILLLGEKQEDPGLDGVKALAIASLFEEPIAPLSEKREAILSADSEVSVLFTSGSAGHKKGVLLSVTNHFASAEASNQVSGLSAGDVWLLSLTLYHVAGLEITYRSALAGAALRVIADISLESICSTLKDHELSHISLIPSMLEQLLDDIECRERLSRMKFIMLGGAASSVRLLDAIESLDLPVHTSYGMSETTSHITITRSGEDISRIRSAGSALPGVEVAILDEDGSACSVSALGEIAVKGANVFLGYLGGNPEKRVLNGWYLTGDSGRFDEADRLHVLGRREDMIISGGENIHLSEIQSVAEQHPILGRCAVVAVEDVRWGQRPVLFYVEDDSQNLRVEELRAFLAERLPSMKVPAAIKKLDSIPETTIGKVDYQALKRQL